MRTDIWTPAEHEIIRTCSTVEDSVRLPHRTMLAIKTMRKKLRVGTPFIRWTKAEIRRLRKYCHEPIRSLVRRFKNRTAESVRQQKSAMGLSFPHVAGALWKTTDLAKLKKLYPLALRSDILSVFPNRSWLAIKAQAGIQGFRRVRRSTTAPNHLYDAVRTRAREDGIALGKLGRQTGCGAYFQNSRSKTVDLNKIDRAVAFFGGKLAIDWQDE
jgi:hypothetical protein